MHTNGPEMWEVVNVYTGEIVANNLSQKQAREKKLELNYGAADTYTTRSMDHAPICIACGHNRNMMRHDGNWYCYATHLR